MADFLGKLCKAKKIGNTSRMIAYSRFVLCKKPHEKRAIRREIAKSVENGDFSQNSKEGTKGNFSKMADFLVCKAKKIGNTSRMIA